MGMEDKDIVRIYIGAVRPFVSDGKKHNKPLLTKMVILAIGCYTRLYKAELDRIVFDNSDERTRMLNEITQNLYHMSFVKKHRSSSLYYSLTEKGARHYATYINSIKSEIYDHPAGHNDF